MKRQSHKEKEKERREWNGERAQGSLDIGEGSTWTFVQESPAPSYATAEGADLPT